MNFYAGDAAGKLERGECDYADYAVFAKASL